MCILLSHSLSTRCIVLFTFNNFRLWRRNRGVVIHMRVIERECVSPLAVLLIVAMAQAPQPAPDAGALFPEPRAEQAVDEHVGRRVEY